MSNFMLLKIKQLTQAQTHPLLDLNVFSNGSQTVHRNALVHCFTFPRELYIVLPALYMMLKQTDCQIRTAFLTTSASLNGYCQPTIFYLQSKSKL